MEMIFTNIEKCKTCEPRKFVFHSSQRLDLRNSNKHVDFQNWSIYYTWKKIREQCKNNKLKMITPMWNDEFELLDGSYSYSILY